MELVRVADRVWFYPFEKERDRPILGYIKGDNWSLAIDAGHSAAHTAEFYKALRERNLELPKLTVLTHWHWDHTFGMNAVSGLCVSNCLTKKYLEDFKEKISRNGAESFFALDEAIRREYSKNTPVIITLPDLVFSGKLQLDAGNCPITLLQTKAPHTDDSTIILVENQKVLFLGDCASGEFPTWEKNPDLCRQLADTIRALDAEICLESHHLPATKREMLDNLSLI